MKPKRYYGLHFISAVYKAMTLGSVILTIGAIGYSIAGESAGGRITLMSVLPQTLGLIIAGGILALTFYVLAQLIDVQLAMNEKMNDVLERLGAKPSSASGVSDTRIFQEVLVELKKFNSTNASLNARAARLQNQPPTSTSQTTP